MLEIHKPQSPGVRAAIEQLSSRMNVGRLIVRYRARRRWSQHDLALRAGTKQSRVSELETLSGNVRFDTLDKIASALGLEVTLQERGIPVSQGVTGWVVAFANVPMQGGSAVATTTAYTPTVESRKVAVA
jgi:DNA-binding Xre family transcriptional regulator